MQREWPDKPWQTKLSTLDRHHVAAVAFVVPHKLVCGVSDAVSTKPQRSMMCHGPLPRGSLSPFQR